MTTEPCAAQRRGVATLTSEATRRRSVLLWSEQTYQLLSVFRTGFATALLAAAVPEQTMSSPPKVKAETRAGHPPAVKAGGMRIVQKHPHTPDTKEDKDKDDQEWESGTSPPKPTVFISGVIARGDKDFPPAAAQVAHQKPHPSVEKLPPPQHVNQYIHQPRK